MWGRKQLDAMNSIKTTENEGKLGVSGRGSKQRKQHGQEPSCSRIRTPGCCGWSAEALGEAEETDTLAAIEAKPRAPWSRLDLPLAACPCPGQ